MNIAYIRVRIQIFTIYFLALVAQYIGKIFFLFKDDRKISIFELEKIIINRSDRMGDAVISYLWIETLILFLKRNNYKGTIVVLSSDLNHWILSPLEKYSQTTVRIISKDLSSYVTNPFVHIFNGLKGAFCAILIMIHRPARKNRACLDLISDPKTLMFLLQEDPYLCVFGPNLALSSWLIDQGLREFYTVEHKNIVENYNALLVQVFLEWDKIVHDITQAYSVRLLNVWEGEKRSGITIFVGVKAFRNLSAIFWAKIIMLVAYSFPDQTITVIDDPEGLIVKELISRIFPPNVIILAESQRLTMLCTFVNTQSCLVGIDGGGMNILRMHAPSLMIYTTGDPLVWSLYSTWELVSESIWNNWYFGFRKWYGHKARYIYRKSFYLPSFEVELEKSFFESFDINSLVHSIKLLI